MSKRFFTSALLALFATPLALRAQGPSVSIQVDHATGKVNPMFYGLLTEEINFSYDGGLYPEMIRDRTIGTARRPLFHWTHVARGNSVVNVAVDDHTGPSTALSRSMKMAVTAATQNAPAGVQNDGYRGMAVRPNTTYTGSFYAKSDSDGLPVTVSLVNDQSGATAASTTVTGLTGEWKQYTFTLKTGQVPVSADNHFQLTVAKPATV